MNSSYRLVISRARTARRSPKTGSISAISAAMRFADSYSMTVRRLGAMPRSDGSVAGLLGRKPEKTNAIRGQAGRGQGGRGRQRPGRGPPQPGGRCRGDDAVAGSEMPGVPASVTRAMNACCGAAPVRGAPFGSLWSGRTRAMCGYRSVAEPAGVRVSSAADEVHRFQDREGPQGDVVQVPDGRGHDVERAGPAGPAAIRRGDRRHSG